MAHVWYVNGAYVPHSQAAVHVEDRGYQFGDAVYEVMAVTGGIARHVEDHLARLGRSLEALAIAWPVSPKVLPILIREVARRNRVSEGVVYIQVGRGVAHRNHLFPEDTPPSLVIGAWINKGPAAAVVEAGVGVATRPDERWKRPDIKTVGLLPNALARQSAKAEQAAYEAWLVDGNGMVTEGSASNAFIVDTKGTVITHPAGRSILGGVTRSNVLKLAAKAGIPLEERPFTADEARGAAEAFISGTTIMVLPVVSIDGHPVGSGKPGPVTKKLRALYQELRNT